jgi:hypothetical protein
MGQILHSNNDQTKRFIGEGIWELRNPSDKESALVRSMVPGDRIAIKSSYVRKRNLPFDNRGNAVSVMAIKAIGTIKENPGDGLKVQVTWNEPKPYAETIRRELATNSDSAFLLNPFFMIDPFRYFGVSFVQFLIFALISIHPEKAMFRMERSAVSF